MDLPAFHLDLPLIIIVGLSLFVFGIFYNMLIARLEHTLHGYRAIAVVFGELVIAVGMAVIYWPAALLMLFCQACAGILMVHGDMCRAIDDRKQAQAEKERLGDMIARGLEEMTEKK